MKTYLPDGSGGLGTIIPYRKGKNVRRITKMGSHRISNICSDYPLKCSLRL